MEKCMAPLMSGITPANPCPKFDEYLSCLVAGCPASMKSQAEQMSTAMKQTNQLFSNCGSGTLLDKAIGNSADQRFEAEGVALVSITMDPDKFVLEEYIAAVKNFCDMVLIGMNLLQ